jgi:hypothetical protein
LPARRGGTKGPAAAYRIQHLRDRERATVEREARAYAHRVAKWQERPPSRRHSARA